MQRYRQRSVKNDEQKGEEEGRRGVDQEVEVEAAGDEITREIASCRRGHSGRGDDWMMRRQWRTTFSLPTTPPSG